jgi:hypothetical protein
MFDLRRSVCRATASVLVCGLLVAFATVVGCRTGQGPSSRPVTRGGAVSKSGVQLWSENCMRCHGLRDPASYGSTGWEVAMHHMRMRADLTAEEYARILDFLGSPE